MKFNLFLVFSLYVLSFVKVGRCQKFCKSTSSSKTRKAGKCPHTFKGNLKFKTESSVISVPDIRPSLFPNVPPFIQFKMHDQQMEKKETKISKFLTWRMKETEEYITIKNTLINSGIYVVSENASEWVYIWDKLMKRSEFYRKLEPHQKVNLIPRTYELFYKDKLWINFKRSMFLHGQQNYDFVPQTFVVPKDLNLLQSTMAAKQSQNNESFWFVKPPRSSQGYKIQVISNWSQVPANGSVRVIQEYIKPLLINKRKFDLRILVLVTSFNPLRIYQYQDGYVRFASMKYSNDSQSLHNRYIHLTNEYINKHSRQYIKNHDINSYNGHAWSLKMFWKYLDNQGVDTLAIKKSIEEMIIKTLIAAQGSIVQHSHITPNRYSTYQLFGFDVGIDDQLKPWLFEVNGSPTTSTNSGLHLAVKGKMFRELFNIANYHLPSTLSKQAKKIVIKKLPEGIDLDMVTFDSRLYTNFLTDQEKLKHEKYEREFNRNQYLEKILELLNPDDVRQLITAEDELSQCDEFTRIFPTKESHNYFKYFEKPHYYNLLLDAWEFKYGQDRKNGIQRLRDLCRFNVHLNADNSNKSRLN